MNILDDSVNPPIVRRLRKSDLGGGLPPSGNILDDVLIPPALRRLRTSDLAGVVVSITPSGTTVGSVLTAAIARAPEGTVVLGWQWQRDGVDISGATASTYTLTSADVVPGTRITVKATTRQINNSFIDIPSAGETLPAGTFYIDGQAFYVDGQPFVVT